MYYRLNKDYALREWKYVNNVIYDRFSPNPIRVDDEMFSTLLTCDSEHDLDEDDKLKDLMDRGYIEPCRRSDHPSEWSRFHKYDHRFMLGMNIMITGKCNYNCLHCFNSADNAELPVFSTDSVKPTKNSLISYHSFNKSKGLWIYTDRISYCSQKR